MSRYWTLSLKITKSISPRSSLVEFVVVQSLSHARLFATPRTAAHQPSVPLSSSRSLLKLTSVESMMPSNHLIQCCPLILLPSTSPSIKVFPSESALCIRWPKYYLSLTELETDNYRIMTIMPKVDWKYVQNVTRHRAEKAQLSLGGSVAAIVGRLHFSLVWCRSWNGQHMGKELQLRAW